MEKKKFEIGFFFGKQTDKQRMFKSEIGSEWVIANRKKTNDFIFFYLWALIIFWFVIGLLLFIWTLSPNFLWMLFIWTLSPKKKIIFSIYYFNFFLY